MFAFYDDVEFRDRPKVTMDGQLVSCTNMTVHDINGKSVVEKLFGLTMIGHCKRTFEGKHFDEALLKTENMHAIFIVLYRLK